jgi:hypothetical protein
MIYSKQQQIPSLEYGITHVYFSGGPVRDPYELEACVGFLGIIVETGQK